MDIKNVFGVSFQRFLIEAATFVDHLQSKVARTKQEDDFIEAFEMIGEIIISPEFLQLMTRKSGGTPTTILTNELEAREGITEFLVEHDDVAIIEIQGKSHRIEGPSIILINQD